MSTIDNYLAHLPPAYSNELERIRRVIHRAVPDVEEGWSYGMPAFTYRGKPLLYFAAFKSHLSLFPTAEPIEVLRDKLTDFLTSKGTLQFTPEKPIPEGIIKQLLVVRIKIIAKS